jgi:dienelactone hydrolase
MQSGDISILINGKPSPAYLALPDSGSSPGVLVLHAWWGPQPFLQILL